ncbi:hypothetical protein HK105_206941 [Polyrhizophydium stewartii]|uniref:DJ-1/PfpI domain-containing protein n=1 Tax=Polyrhizophydium stewartii TaxID=2732419 RepID=A0ABR4N1T4_9FUNG|nr:hypothetical protein HK105_005690 [Polyrhizophydium stewartii]
MTQRNANPTAENPLIVDILGFDGADELDAIVPFEVLRFAQSFGAPMQVRMVSCVPDKPIVFSQGLEVRPAKAIVPGEADIVIVPGGYWGPEHPVSLYTACHTGHLAPTLRALAALPNPPIFASVCTGSIALAFVGIITSSTKATTHHSFRDAFESIAGVAPLRKRFVDDGGILSAGGISSGFDLSLHIIERFFGKEMARQCSEVVEYPMNRSMYPDDDE